MAFLLPGLKEFDGVLFACLFVLVLFCYVCSFCLFVCLFVCFCFTFKLSPI